MIAYYNENDPFCAEWLRNLIAAGHLPPGDVDERDVREVAADDLAGYDQVHLFAGIGGWPYALQLAGWPAARPVWTGSCPCQPYSSAGKRLGDDDPRNLWPEFRRLVAERRPQLLLGEQVAGKAGRLWLAGVRADLEALGFTVGCADLPAASVGAPHIRQRLWWVADAGSYGSASRDTWGIETPNSETTIGRSSIINGRNGGAGRLADHLGAGLEGRAEQSAWRKRASAERSGDAGRLANTRHEARSAEFGIEPQGVQEHDGLAGGLCDSGFWFDFDLIPCADGKARRVEPGTSPLVDWISEGMGRSRAGMLRAYGNAIVPPLAAEFIKAYMETT